MRPSPAPALFTAARLAATIGSGCTPQLVRRELRGVPPSARQAVYGGPDTAHWSLAALPPSLFAKLEAARIRRGFHDVSAMLQEATKPWQPTVKGVEVPMAGLAPEDRAYAQRLQLALRAFLALENYDALTSSQFKARGVEAYTGVFGQPIGQRQWWNVYRRALDRDGGLGDWDRLEIYLPERPSIAGAPRPVPCEPTEFADLAELVAACADPFAPTPDEHAAIWAAACGEHDTLVGRGALPKQARRRLCAFLHSRASGLSPSREYLRKAFGKQLRRWRQRPGDATALRDQRQNNTGNLDGYEPPQQDLELLAGRHSGGPPS